jgi:hypothetical protein
MKTGLNKAIIAIGFCAIVLLFAGSARAEDAQQVAEELVDGLGISNDVADSLASGPGDTFGQRLQGMLDNGSVTQKQFDAISNRFLALPDEKRWLIKGKYDQGGGMNLDTLHNVVNPQDPGSVKQHAKDLRDQGYTKEQIAARLKAEGVAPDKINAAIFSQGVSDPSRPDHYKDARDAGAQERVDAAHQRYQNTQGQASDTTATGSIRGGHIKDNRDAGNQPQADKAHERYQNRKAEPSKIDHAKDRPQGAKSIRDTRRENRGAPTRRR